MVAGVKYLENHLCYYCSFSPDNKILTGTMHKTLWAAMLETKQASLREVLFPTPHLSQRSGLSLHHFKSDPHKPVQGGRTKTKKAMTHTNTPQKVGSQPRWACCPNWLVQAGAHHPQSAWSHRLEHCPPCSAKPSGSSQRWVTALNKKCYTHPGPQLL